jgi:hypothetical protein
MAAARAVRDLRIDLENPNTRPAAGFDLTGGIKGFLKHVREPRSRTKSKPASVKGTHANPDEPDRAHRSTRPVEKPRSGRRERQEPHDAPDTRVDARVEGAGTADVTGPIETSHKQPAGPPGSATSNGDEAWLATFHLRSSLKDRRNFDRQALLWRQCQLLIDQIRQLYEPSAGDLFFATGESTYRGCFSYALAVPMGVLPPDRWLPCSDCDGTGQQRDREQRCGVCCGTGYVMTHLGECEPAG